MSFNEIFCAPNNEWNMFIGTIDVPTSYLKLYGIQTLDKTAWQNVINSVVILLVMASVAA